ncbi:MAG TPA: class II fructose-bisphosphate aldolase [Steroidobacteraceae bacterium]|jgi:fructose-bisphosphate aldolase class II|nr:class II fructose-bisphosphate aldolase [Steroidobacteraceae bacterium]
MLVNLAEVLGPAAERSYSVASFNIFGWEDARAVVDAAGALGAPVVLAVNLDFRQFMPLEVIAVMLRRLAVDAATPVCVHLDHCYDLAEIRRAVDAGFTSVMYDGSQLPLAENIAGTRTAVQYAHAARCSVEAEIGSVPYAEGRAHIKSELTEAADAGRLAAESGADALAISIGNVHRLTTPGVAIDFGRLAEIESVVRTPLVIHGASGILETDIARLARTRVAKFNVGTVLRQAFGASLRETLARYPQRFDRLQIMGDVMGGIRGAAARMIGLLGWSAPQDEAMSQAR